MDIYEEYIASTKLSISDNLALESIQETFELTKRTYTSTNAGIIFYKTLQELKSNKSKAISTLSEVKPQNANKIIANTIFIKDQTLIIQLIDDVIFNFIESAFTNNMDLSILTTTLDRILTLPVQNVKLIVNISDTFIPWADYYLLAYVIEPIIGFFRNKDTNVTIEYVGYNGLLSLFFLEIVNNIKINPFSIFLIDSEEYKNFLKEYEDTKITADYYFDILKNKGILTSEEIDKLTKSNELILLTAEQIQQRFQQSPIGGNE